MTSTSVDSYTIGTLFKNRGIHPISNIILYFIVLYEQLLYPARIPNNNYLSLLVLDSPNHSFLFKKKSQHIYGLSIPSEDNLNV